MLIREAEDVTPMINSITVSGKVIFIVSIHLYVIYFSAVRSEKIFLKPVNLIIYPGKLRGDGI